MLPGGIIGIYQAQPGGEFIALPPLCFIVTATAVLSSKMELRYFSVSSASSRLRQVLTER